MSDTLHHASTPRRFAPAAPLGVTEAHRIVSTPMPFDPPSRLPAALAIATLFVLLLALPFALVTG